MARKKHKSGTGSKTPNALTKAAIDMGRRIEDEYDIAVAAEAYAEYERSGCKSRPISELWKELDL
mgnify:CR=1 FL=1